MERLINLLTKAIKSKDEIYLERMERNLALGNKKRALRYLNRCCKYVVKNYQGWERALEIARAEESANFLEVKEKTESIEEYLDILNKLGMEIAR